jgi:hypothetical protein
MSTLPIDYETDFQHWLERQIFLLKNGQVDELDKLNLIGELEDMAKTNLRELQSRLLVLIAHLLKWQYQLASLSEQWQNFEATSWRKTIIEQRLQLLDLLDEVPSLKNKLAATVDKTYPKAVKFALDETGLPDTTFPSECPYSIEQLLDRDFYPL